MTQRGSMAYETGPTLRLCGRCRVKRASPPEHNAIIPLSDRRVLEGGRGQWLVDLESWGAERENLARIELDPDEGRKTQWCFPGVAGTNRVGYSHRVRTFALATHPHSMGQ